MQRGQAFLALVLLIGGLALAAGITLAFVSNSFINVGYGYRASVQAQAAATSGAEDALLRLARDAAFASAGYSFAAGSTTVSVSVTQNIPSVGFATVSSTATVSNHTRTLAVIAAVNASTSQVKVVSWQVVQ
ncbi:MAG: hypothetical protein M1282_16085 [Chloroflexi bacterium]|nr:hypothetical protein [Chloroflexota bacterium]